VRGVVISLFGRNREAGEFTSEAGLEELKFVSCFNLRQIYLLCFKLALGVNSWDISLKEE